MLYLKMDELLKLDHNEANKYIDQMFRSLLNEFAYAITDLLLGMLTRLFSCRLLQNILLIESIGAGDSHFLKIKKLDEFVKILIFCLTFIQNLLKNGVIGIVLKRKKVLKQ